MSNINSYEKSYGKCKNISNCNNCSKSDIEHEYNLIEY